MLARDPPKAVYQFARTSWSAIDGIAGPVRALAQTPDGYLWIGTFAGLYRFDGLRIVPWEPIFGERLPDSPVQSLLTARDGSLWIGLRSGTVSHLLNGSLRNYLPAEGTPAGGTFSMVEDGSGALWAGGPYGFSKFENGTWRRVGAELGYAAPGVQTLLVDKKGNLWVATDGFDYRLSKDPVARNTILMLAPGSKRFAGTGEALGLVWTMAEAPDGTIWMAHTTGDTVRPVMGQRGAHSAIALGSEPYSLLFDTHGSVWIGMGRGVWRVADYTQSKRSALSRLDSGDNVPQRRVLTGLQDREGNLWFGTTDGIERFRENKVTPYSEQDGLIGGFDGLTSTSDGRIWLFDYSVDAIQAFGQGRFLNLKLPGYSQSDSTRILSMYADRSNHLWLGGSFQLAEGVNGKFSFLRIPALESRASVHAIAKDAAGNLWITVWEGAKGGGILRLQNGKWFDFRERVALPNYRCRVLYGDSSGRVWMGFEDGEVAVYEGRNFRLFNAKDGLAGGRILTITSDRSGHIWVGSEDGLSRFEHGRFLKVTKANGLPGNSVSGILQDDDGDFWLAAPLAIFHVSPRELENALASPLYKMQGTSLDALDGLPGLPREREPFPTATRTPDGRLWFATTGGVAVLDPRHLRKNLLPPPVVIETLKADGRVLSASSGLRLQPGTRNLEFQYAALSLTAPERVRFRYRLEGYDDDWHGPLEARQATYTNLPARNYRFRVIACNNDGIWNERGSALDFSILPAFYQTLWFRLSGVFAFLAMLWALHRHHLHEIGREFNVRLEERVDERVRIARELHDTLLQSFQGSLIQMQAARNTFSRRPEQAVQTLEDAITMAEGVIGESRDAIQDLRCQPADHTDLAELLTITGQDLARAHDTNQEANGTPAIFRVTVEGERQDLDPLLQDEAYRIARELLRNAFRHADARHVEVDIRYEDRVFRMRIRDDGKGIEAETLNGSDRTGHWGLLGIRERAKRIGAQLNFWSGAGAGTEVELRIPASIAYGATRRRRGLPLLRKRRRRTRDQP